MLLSKKNDYDIRVTRVLMIKAIAYAKVKADKVMSARRSMCSPINAFMRAPPYWLDSRMCRHSAPLASKGKKD
jgi:hypothetical protein